MKDGENDNDAFGDFIGIVAVIKIDGETWQKIFSDHDQGGYAITNETYHPENVSGSIIETDGKITAFTDAGVTIMRETETNNHDDSNDVDDYVENGRSCMGEFYAEIAAGDHCGDKKFWHKNHQRYDDASETKID